MEPVNDKTPSRRNAANLKKAWPVLLVVLALNVWYDYYHPAAILVDVILVLILIIKFSK